VLEACTVVERVGMVLELLGAMVPPAVVVPVEVLAAVAMAAHVEWLLERSAQLVGSAAAVEDLVPVLCHTWELARESTYRRQHTSTLELEVILTQFDQEEISPASSPVAAC